MQSSETIQEESPKWFVMRDLKRPNSKTPAYKVLPELGVKVFTPMHWVLKESGLGKKIRLYLPYIPSLLFARAVRSDLDKIVERTETLQYRFVKGAPKGTPMVVPASDMDRFIRAVNSSQSCQYFSPDELGPEMIGKEVMIKGGPLDGNVGKLMKVKGSKKKRLLVDLKGIIVAAVEVSPEFIQIL